MRFIINKYRWIFVCLLTLLAGAAFAGDPIWDFDKDDPEMNAAISSARATLPIFEEKMRQADLENELMLLKVALPYGDNNYEHIWCAVLGKKDEVFFGYISNDPVYIDAKQYDPVSFGVDQVSDWTYWQDDKMEGSYTTRVMLKHLEEDYAASIRAQLAPLPGE